MRLRLLLAHNAEVQAGMLYILGGGWNEIGPDPAPFGITGIIEVSWDETNRPHDLDITIIDADGQPFRHPTPTGEQEFRVHAQVVVGRPPNAIAGQSFNLPLALNFPPLPFRRGTVYIVRGSINGDVLDQVPFVIRPEPQQQPQRQQ